MCEVAVRPFLPPTVVPNMFTHEVDRSAHVVEKDAFELLSSLNPMFSSAGTTEVVTASPCRGEASFARRLHRRTPSSERCMNEMALTLAKEDLEQRLFCEGHMGFKRKNWVGNSWRFVTMHSQTLRIYKYTMENMAWSKTLERRFQIQSGRMWVMKSRKEFGVVLVEEKTDEELFAVLPSKADLARWLTAFHQLEGNTSLPKAITSNTSQSQQSSEASTIKKVSFEKCVRVRTYPSIDQPTQSELFYSEEEVHQFTSQAYSLTSRTVHYFQSIWCKVFRCPK